MPAASQNNEPSFKYYAFSQLIGWGVFLVLRLIITGIYCAKRPEMDAVAAYQWEIIDHLVMAASSHMIWRWMHWRRLFDKPWRQLFLEGFAASMVIGALTSFIVWQPCFQVYQAEVARIGVEAMTWFLVMQHELVMVLWFSATLAIYYFDRTRQLELQRAEACSATREAQLHALKGQINPHFLFNSFNSLRALIDENPAKARDAVTHLSVILRYSLSGAERKVVPLSEELRVVSLYLELEKLRLGPRLNVTITVAPDTAGASVPPLMIQGLVENAVKFGPAARKQGGEVTCEARMRSNGLCIRVTNTGILASSTDSTGTGLKNLRDRLRLIYGPEATFSLWDGTDNRVIAELIIPTAPAGSNTAVAPEPAAELPQPTALPAK